MKLDLIARMPYSIRGYPARIAKLLINGKRYSAIGIMSTTALLDCYIVEGTSDRDVFYSFVQSSLLQHLMPFNGQNPNSIVIIDNCLIHHVPQSVGALIIFLLPYSPHLMPIEECFSKVKLF